MVWYQRPTGAVAWRVLRVAGRSTLEPGAHLGHPVAAGAKLPTGEYRADVYVAGHKVPPLEPVKVEREWPYERTNSASLAMSLLVPTSWTTTSDVPGVSLTVGPDTGDGVILGRKEGVRPESDLVTFLDHELDTLVRDTYGDRVPTGGSATTTEYFAGLESVRVRRYGGGTLVVAAGLESYAGDALCGGSLFTAAVGGPAADRTTVATVFNSIILDDAPIGLPAVTDADTRVAQLDKASLKVPEGWMAARRPPASTDRRKFPAFTLLSREQVSVQGSVAAEQLTYTWTSPNGPVWQRQTYASTPSTFFVMTFTVPVSLLRDFRDESDRFSSSLLV